MGVTGLSGGSADLITKNGKLKLYVVSPKCLKFVKGARNRKRNGRPSLDGNW